MKAKIIREMKQKLQSSLSSIAVWFSNLQQTHNQKATTVQWKVSVKTNTNSVWESKTLSASNKNPKFQQLTETAAWFIYVSFSPAANKHAGVVFQSYFIYFSSQNCSRVSFCKQNIIKVMNDFYILAGKSVYGDSYCDWKNV